MADPPVPEGAALRIPAHPAEPAPAPAMALLWLCALLLLALPGAAGERGHGGTGAGHGGTLGWGSAGWTRGETGMGQRLRGPAVITLLPAGVCSQPPTFVFAEPTTAPQQSYPERAVVRYRCRPGYVRNGNESTEVTCLANSTWSRISTFCIGGFWDWGGHIPCSTSCPFTAHSWVGGSLPIPIPFTLFSHGPRRLSRAHGFSVCVLSW